MLKVANILDMMSENFQSRETQYYRIRNGSKYIAYPIHNVYNGNESACYLETKIWEFVPDIEIWVLSQILKIKLRNEEPSVAHVDHVKLLLTMPAFLKICQLPIMN